MYKQSLKYFGYLVTLLSFYYIYQVLAELKISLSQSQELASNLNYAYLMISGIFYLMVLSIGAIVWINIISIASNKKIINKYELINVYAKSNLGKYMPGNFMQFVGRNVLGNRLGYKHSVLAFSTLIEIMLSVFTGFIILFVLYFFIDPNLPSHLFNYISKMSTLYLIILSFIFVSLIFLVFKLRILDKLMALSSHNLCIKDLYKLFVYYIVTFILMGLINLFVFESMNPIWTLSITDYMNILFVFIISWIVGFLMPGAPGGIGVREAIFIFILSHSYDILIITLASILIRLVNITGDVVFVFINLYFKKQSISK